jgi:hypothetical protein
VPNPPGTVERFRKWFVKVLFNEVRRTGGVSKKTWDDMGLWTDGSEMCDNEAVTHRMRALDLSSDHQRELRASVLLNAVTKVKQAKEEEANKHIAAVTSVRHAEAEILLSANIIHVDDTVKKKAERQAAAHALRELMTDETVHQHLAGITDKVHFKAIGTGKKCKDFTRSRKGAKYPLAAGRELQEQQAFTVRGLAVLPEFKNTIHAPADDVAPPAPRPAPVIISVGLDVPVSRVHEQPAARGPPPSELLRRSAFRAGMATAFPVGRAAVARLDVDEAHLEAVCACANTLATLKPRFDDYVTTSQRIKTDEQRNAPCWKFMSREWNVLCAIAAAHGHVGLDRDRIVATKACGESPLVSPADGTTFTPVSDGEESIGALQGTYLHFCKLLQRWIRSGSTSGKEDRGFAPRNKEHATGAELGGDAMRSNFYVNYRTTAANDAYPDLSPAKGRWDKLQQYVAIGFVRVEAESTVTLLQQLAQSLRSDVEEAKAKQNYATERVTAAEEELRLLSEGGAGRPSRAGAPHVGGGADAAGHGVGGAANTAAQGVRGSATEGRGVVHVDTATASLGQEDNARASSDQHQPRQKRRGGAVADNPTSGAAPDLPAPRKSARIAAGPPSTTLSAAGGGRRGPHTSQQGAHTSEPANSTVTAEPPASAATPEPASTTTTTSRRPLPPPGRWPSAGSLPPASCW